MSEKEYRLHEYFQQSRNSYTMIDQVMYLWAFLTFIAVVISVLDFRHQPILGIQKSGWFLVILYTGAFGLLFYFLGCGSPKNIKHEDFVRSLWKQALNSEVHCVAGDATGIIVAAIALSF